MRMNKVTVCEFIKKTVPPLLADIKFVQNNMFKICWREKKFRESFRFLDLNELYICVAL